MDSEQKVHQSFRVYMVLGSVARSQSRSG